MEPKVNMYRPRMLIILLQLSLLFVGSVAHVPNGLPCFDFSFSVSIPNFTDVIGVIPAATYDIAATYCPPLVIRLDRLRTVQLLVHGSILNKLYWSAEAPVGSSLAYQPGNYSWVQYAREQGYNTIAIDRLGTGNSTHPDPTLVRLQLHAEIINKIATKLRVGGFFGTNLPGFRKVIGVGHSLGTFILGLLVPKYPHAFDALVMSSFIYDLSHSGGGPPQEANSASIVFPSRFGNLPPGYETIVSADNFRTSFFSLDGEFDPALPPLIWSREDVSASGESASLFAIAISPNYTSFLNVSGTGFTADVVFIIGSEDEPLCSGNCGPTGFLPSTLAFFAGTPGHIQGSVINNTGHLLSYHYTAQTTFATAHNFLAASGY